MKISLLSYIIFFLAWDRILMNLTPIAIKFMILGLVVAPVAIGMLFKDEQLKSPKKLDVILTFFTSLVFVWIGYEMTIQYNIPSVLCLIASFFIGLFSLPIVLSAKKHLIKLIGTCIEALGDFFKKLLNK